MGPKAAKTFLCHEGSLLMTYFGLPIGDHSSRIATWDPIIGHMNKKNRYMEREDVIIKSSLSSLPLYFMSLFPIPMGVVNKIVKI